MNNAVYNKAVYDKFLIIDSLIYNSSYVQLLRSARMDHST